ncbi:MAG: type II secretion system protein [Verrucomicrobia bacterium]|nr:type II secretion system protein [Verrucomicrobiota bacterium]
MKRPYLLLEVLVSFALVALCATPLLHSQFSAKQKEEKRLLEIERAYMADEAFDQIRMKFYTHEISWEDLQRNKPVEGKLDKLSCTYTIREYEKYKKGDRALYRINAITISFGKDLDYDYHLFTERVDPDKRQS